MSSSSTPAPTASSSSSASTETLALGHSSGGRVSGKFWKASRAPTVRSMMPAGVKSASWEARQEKRKKDEAIKLLQNQLKEEREAEEERKRTAIKDRRTRLEEKKRLEEMAARMSAKKLQRMKKRLGRSKKVNG
ncbi:Cgr1 [Phaffia rhodozyma]|uniref:rRNA-processing protein n=1 Tax=Phaffia rhodozyma TaxID=264483 RepID=A0A0F7SIV9_PHARH|nr:Cgr1 [Phaffia rhodozyma]